MSSSSESQVQTRLLTPSLERASLSSTKPGLLAAAYPQQPASGGLSCPPSRLAEISNRPYTAVNAPSALESQLQEPTHIRPVSAYTGYNNEERSNAKSFPSPLTPPVYFPRPNSATSDVLGTIPKNPVFPPCRSLLSTIGDASSEVGEQSGTAMHSNRPNTPDSMLPPRRELPFQHSPQPLSSGSDSVRPPSRPSTSMMGPPPLPARVASLRPSSNQGVELPPLPQPTIIGQFASRTLAMQQPPRTPTQDCNTHFRGKTSPHEEGESQRLPNWSPASSPLPGETASSILFPKSQSLSPLSGSAQTLREIMSHKTPATPPTSEPPCQNPSSSEQTTRFDPDSVDNLAAYAMQSDEGRRAALNEFIFRHLESDDFLTLVEDMETCWARVALGMR